MSDVGCQKEDYIDRADAGDDKDDEVDQCFRRCTRRCDGKLRTVGEATSQYEHEDSQIMARHVLYSRRHVPMVGYCSLHVTTTGDEMVKCLGPTVLLSRQAAATLGDGARSK